MNYKLDFTAKELEALRDAFSIEMDEPAVQSLVGKLHGSSGSVELTEYEIRSLSALLIRLSFLAICGEDITKEEKQLLHDILGKVTAAL